MWVHSISLSSCFQFFKVYTQPWSCWIIWEFDVYVFKEALSCFPQQLPHFLLNSSDHEKSLLYRPGLRIPMTSSTGSDFVPKVTCPSSSHCALGGPAGLSLFWAGFPQLPPCPQVWLSLQTCSQSPRLTVPCTEAHFSLEKHPQLEASRPPHCREKQSQIWE